MKNGYGEPEYASIIADLKAELKRVREELNETDDAYPEIQAIIDTREL